MNLPEKVWLFSGNNPGKTVTVIGSIHGNERVGAEIIYQLQKLFVNLEIDGKLYLVIGNPSAYDANVRYIDEDLNRLFGSDFNKLTSRSIESKRALELAPILSESDYLLDIHCTTKKSVPFVYCEPSPAHKELAQLFGTDFVVSPSETDRPEDLTCSTDNFVDNHGGIGITYEAGWLKNSEDTDSVLNKVKLFLQITGIYDFGLKHENKVYESLFMYDSVIPASDNFSFKKDFVNFDFVAKGDIIAVDDRKELVADQDCFVIFPKQLIKKGDTACYLAHKNN